jgi:hypothetical protein
VKIFSLSCCLTTLIASGSVGAFQKPSNAAAALRMRHALHAFDRM